VQPTAAAAAGAAAEDVYLAVYLQDTDTRTGRDRDCDRCALRLPTALVALAEPTWSLKLVADCWCRLKVVFILARAATFALLAHVRRFPSLGFHFQ